MSYTICRRHNYVLDSYVFYYNHGTAYFSSKLDEHSYWEELSRAKDQLWQHILAMHKAGSAPMTKEDWKTSCRGEM